MGEDYNYVREVLDKVSYAQNVTLITCFVIVLLIALMHRCTDESLARIEAKLNMEAPPILKKKGE